MILCVAGNPSIDKLFEVGRLVPGDIHRPDAFVALPGGKGIHVAQVATALGGDAIVTGLLGGHAGRWVAETLEAEGVRCRFGAMSGETRSSLSVADRETGRLTEFYEDGPPLTSEEWGELEQIVYELLPRASWLALAGSLPPGTPQNGYAKILAAAQSSRVRTALDARGEALQHTIEHHPHLVKINAAEAEELLETPSHDPEGAQRAAAEIRLRIGGEGHAAVVTMGEAGMVMAGPDGALYRGSLPAKGRYPVGSGDAFLAGMLVALDRSEDWPAAAALALGAAAANAETPGAAQIIPARANELAIQAEVNRVG